MREMKDSGVEWIGKIPANWEITTYRRLLSRRKEYNDTPDKQVLSLTTSGVKRKFIEENYGKMAADYTGHQIVKEGDLVFTPRDFDATPILSGIAPCDGCISNLYFILFPLNPNEVYLPYINYFMWGVKWGGDIWKRLSYGMRFSYNFSQFASLPALKPPYTIQRKISDFLDAKCTKIDDIVAQQQQVIEKLMAYKLSVITEAVTKGLNPDAPMKDSNVEWIGAIPQNWRLSHIGNLAEMGSGGTPDRQKIEYWTEGTIPWMASGEINYEYVYETNEKITELGMQNSNAKLLPVNTVMLGLIGQGKTKGLTAILKIESACNQNLAYLIPSPKLLHYSYLFYCFKAMYYYVRGLVGDSQAGIYLYFLKKLYIPLPEVDEQVSIAKSLDNKCAKIDIVITKKQSLINKLIEHKKSLIYEAVTGKLEV